MLVEFALLLPLLMLLVVGAAWLSIAYGMRQEGMWQAQQAVKAAAGFSDADQRCEAASGVLWALRDRPAPPGPAMCTESEGLLVSERDSVLWVSVAGRLASPPLVDWFMPHCSDGSACIWSRAGWVLP